MSDVVESLDGLIPLYENGKYGREFKKDKKINGIGSFGYVVRAIENSSGDVYAIKKSIIRSKEDYDFKIRGLDIWRTLGNNKFVQYKNIWLEKYNKQRQDQFIKTMFTQIDVSIAPDQMAEFKKDKKLEDFAILYIQMEMCLFSLRDVIQELRDYFECKTRKLLPKLGYYIACELLIEILDNINYLHTRDPHQILHRDIKPENILIQKPNRDAKFVKISDFGLAVLHDYPDISHTQMRGTLKYMAPEVMTSRKYDMKADVYSIGVMVQELFNFDINDNLNEDVLKQYRKLMDLTGLTMNGQRKVRPDCLDILDVKVEWVLEYKDVKDDIVKKIDINKDYDIIKEFIPYFLKTKYVANEKLN